MSAPLLPPEPPPGRGPCLVRPRPRRAPHASLRTGSHRGPERMSRGPGIAAEGSFVGIPEKGAHVLAVEELLALGYDILPDIGQVERPPGSFRRRLQPQDVVVAAVVDHAADRPSGDGKDVPA